jgi:hypothetical protein
LPDFRRSKRPATAPIRFWRDARGHGSRRQWRCAAAISAFSAIGKDVSQPVAIRDAARMRAAYLLIDHGSY